MKSINDYYYLNMLYYIFYRCCKPINLYFKRKKSLNYIFYSIQDLSNFYFKEN